MKLLDLFCGAGGAAMGYYRAGFKDITDVDNRPMPRYPLSLHKTQYWEAKRKGEKPLKSTAKCNWRKGGDD